ncbi:MAG: TatD family hydrolase [Bacteroidales bacterium]|nr:TatD family hydrolase [Bacteroidales bacterium]
MIDTHCHLFLSEYDPDRQQIIEKCINAGIEKMINPNVDDTTLNNLKELTTKFPKHIYAAYGLHPCSVKSDYRIKLELIRSFAAETSMVAVGEIGIDLYWDTNFLNEQKKALEIQFQWAIEKNLPVIVHTRNGFDVAYEIVQTFSGLTGVFHAFTGNREQAIKLIEKGFYLGIGGIITFKNSGLDRVVSELPLDYILLETDSPYLAPAPYRGKRNEPIYLRQIAEKIAMIKNIGIEEVEAITTENAKRLFKL